MIKVTLLFLLTASFASAQLPVIVRENFEKNNYGWPEREAYDHKLFFRGGKYFMEAQKGGWESLVAPYVENAKDFSLEATFTVMEAANDDGTGITWGADGKQNQNSFIFSSDGYFRIWCSDSSVDISREWRKTDLLNPLGKENRLKVEQKNGALSFFVNGKAVASAPRFPWHGKNIGFVTYSKKKLFIDDFVFSHDIEIVLPTKHELPVEKENLGRNINSIYNEVSPKISVDGKVLYFGRQSSPENIGGTDDREDIWESVTTDGKTWAKSSNLGPPLNSSFTDNLISVSADNNTFLFHINGGFGFTHRTANGWSALEDLGIRIENESQHLEGNLSADGKVIIFAARLKANAFYKPNEVERDIYVCLNRSGRWSAPIHTGKILNSPGEEYSPFLSADGNTLYFASDGRPGYGDADVFMSRRLSDDWNQWSEPVNLGIGINTVGFDGHYTLPASGDYAYMVSNIQTIGKADIIRLKPPESVKPDPVVLVSGKVLNAKTQRPLPAMIRFDDLKTGAEVGEARVDPRTGDYKIILPAGKNYGFHAAAHGYLSVNENLELIDLKQYSELKKDLLLVPIAIGESIQLKNVFFVQSKSDLRPESHPELDRLVRLMAENPTVEIELSGHTDNRGTPSANLELSEKRVEAVKVYLVSKGIAPRRVTGKGYGGTKPIADNESEESRQLNRRVDFKIVKK